jgi:hypothetical protein
MRFGAAYRRPIALGCALAGLLTLSQHSVAAPRAAELGPPAPLAEPSGGYVGQIKVSPAHGPVGTPVTVIGEGFARGQDFDLVWGTLTGRWKVSNAEYFGREYTPAAYRIAAVRSDAAGRIAATFTAPDDFGFQHDVMLQQGGRLLTKDAFSIDMTVKLLADNVPVGTPIPIEVQGIGWRELEGSWVMLYDNRFTGWISAVTTGGTARFTVPAAGQPGRHVIEVVHSDFTFPYRNIRRRTDRNSRWASTSSKARLCCRSPRRSSVKRWCAGCRLRASLWRRRPSRASAGRWWPKDRDLCPASPWHSTGRPSPETASAAVRRALFSLA